MAGGTFGPNNSLPDAVTLQNAAGADGNGTVLDCDGFSSVVVAISGTFSATINHEVSMNGTTWYAIADAPIDGTSGATTRTAAAAVRVPCAGFKRYRARVSGFASGTVTVLGRGAFEV